jgi:hypothetical protein
MPVAFVTVVPLVIIMVDIAVTLVVVLISAVIMVVVDHGGDGSHLDGGHFYDCGASAGF